MNTLFDVKKTVQTLVGDDENGTLTDAYLVPKINFAYRIQVLAIMQATGTNLEQIIEIPDAVDADGNSTSKGLMSLAALQQPGQPLDGLLEPLHLWWKRAGAPDQAYRECFDRKTLPFVPAKAAGIWGAMYFTWRGNQLFVTPVGCPVDILVDGRYNAPSLVKNEDQLSAHPMMEIPVTVASLSLCGVEMGNPGFVAMRDLAKETMDNICNLVMMDKQGYTVRAGSMSNRGRRGWFWR
jgi:hypothetical protein